MFVLRHHPGTLVALGAFALGAALTSACLGPGTLNEAEPCAADGPSLIAERCLGCHSAAVVGAARGGAPEGINYDDEAGIAQNAAGIREQVEAGAMPPKRPLAACDVETLEAYLDGLP